MFWSKENAYKKFSVIIIPERGSSTRTLKLSANILKIVMAVLFVVLAFIAFLIIQNLFLRSDISVMNQKDDYIRTLEKDNKANLEMMDKYNKNEAVIQKKLKEIQQLEDSVKSKLKKSISSRKLRSNAVSVNINYNNENLIMAMDKQIAVLSQLGKELDYKLAEEEKMPSIWPCFGFITSNFGFRKNPFDGISSDFHPGMDIACSPGTKVYAAASGTVICASYNSGYGNEVSINHHNGLESIYGHNSKICVHVGQAVKKGQLIALSGSTGSSTGPHLHFEVRKNNKPINPKPFFFKGEE